MKTPAKQLTLAHVSEFVPRQLFEMVAPSGETYLLELAMDTEDEIKSAIKDSNEDPNLPVFPIKNLNAYSAELPIYSFNQLKQLLSTIKRYQPCWTNKW